MGLYRRSKTYWCSLQCQGKRVHESLKTENKKLAEKRYAKILTDIVEGRFFEKVKAKETTYRQMVDKYLKKYRKSRDETSLNQLLPVFGNMVIADITTESVSDYMEERLIEVRPATVYQELALMRRMFNVARKEWKWVKDNPIADLSFSVGNDNARDRWLTFEEEEQLLKSASPEWLRNLIIFALRTGMRRGEILSLKWSSVDFKRRLITVEKSKNGMKRSIPMSEAVFDMLKDVKVIDISNIVFPFNINTINDGFRRAKRKADVHDFKFHDCRHTFATRLVQNGVDIYKVKELLGHKSISVTMRYAHHYPESLRSSIEILDKCYKSVTLDKEHSCEKKINLKNHNVSDIRIAYK